MDKSLPRSLIAGCGIPFALKYWADPGSDFRSLQGSCAGQLRRQTTTRGEFEMPTITRRQALAIPAGFALGSLAPRAALAADSIKVGLVAALSGPSAKSGEGITRGLTIAIDEINARGGVLGRQIELVRRD